MTVKSVAHWAFWKNGIKDGLPLSEAEYDRALEITRNVGCEIGIPYAICWNKDSDVPTEYMHLLREGVRERIAA